MITQTDTTNIQKALVVCQATFLDVDKLCSAVVLGKALSRKLGQNVDIYFGETSVPKAEITSVAAPQGVNFLESLEGNYFTVVVDKGDAQVREVKWEETGGKLKLIIFTDSGDILGTEHPATPGVRQYESIYTLGIHNQEHIEKVLGDHFDVWSRAEATVSIDNRPHNQSFAKANHNYPDSKSFAEAVLQFALAEDLELTGSDSTELLSCIYWKTASLKNKYTTAHTFQHITQLINRGADIQMAGTRIYSTLSFSEAKARADIYSSLKITASGLAFAQVTKDTAGLLSRIRPLHPEKSPLFQLKDTLASFVLVPVSEKTTYVLASSHSDKVSLRHFFATNQLVGDPMQSEFSLSMNVTDAERYISTQLKEALDKDTPVPPTELTAVEPTMAEAVQETLPPEPLEEPVAQSFEDEIQELMRWQEATAEPIETLEEPELDLSQPALEAAPVVSASAEIDADPLPRASGEIKAAEAPEEELDMGMPGGFGGMGGFGSMGGGAPQANPLPPAKS